MRARVKTPCRESHAGIVRDVVETYLGCFDLGMFRCKGDGVGSAAINNRAEGLPPCSSLSWIDGHLSGGKRWPGLQKSPHYGTPYNVELQLPCRMGYVVKFVGRERLLMANRDTVMRVAVTLLCCNGGRTA